MTRLSAFTLIATFVFAVPGLAANAVSDPAGPGPYAVGFTSFMFLDGTRPAVPGLAGRHIPVYVWYPVDPTAVNASTARAVYQLEPVYRPDIVTPSSAWESYGSDPAYQEPPAADGGPFPLLMLSPGLNLKGWALEYLATRVASHGFVVASTSHAGAKTFPWEPSIANQAVLAITACVHNPRDVSFALTKILEQNTATGALLYGTIDDSRIAAGGHSLGGYSAMALAGGDDQVCDTGGPSAPPETCVPTTPDPRIKALVLLDGSNQFLHFYELARITIPALSLNQEWATILDWQARQHAALNGHPSYRVDLLNSVHPSFVDYCEMTYILGEMGLFTPAQVAARLQAACMNLPSAEAHRIVKQYVVAFLQTNLAGKPGYQQFLTPGFALTHEPNVEFFVTEKRDDHSIDDDWPGYFIYFLHQPGRAQAYGEKDPATIRPEDQE